MLFPKAITHRLRAATSNLLPSVGQVLALKGLAAQACRATKPAGNIGNGCVILNAGFSIDFKNIVFICLTSLPVSRAFCFTILPAKADRPPRKADPRNG